MSGQPEIVDLLELLRLAPETMKLALLLRDVSVINRYAIETRYPGDWEPITRVETEEAVAIARRVRQTIRICLPQEAIGG